MELNLSDAELTVMRVIWTLGKASADEVGAELKNFNWSPSTVKTFLARLTKKNILTPTRVGHKYIYCPNISEDDTIEKMTQEFLRKVCAKKHADVLLNMIDSSSFTLSDKEKISHKIVEKDIVSEVKCDCIANLQVCSC